jgi:hypothetical protein
MKFGKLVPFGVALAWALSGCSSAPPPGPQCDGGCGPNSSCVVVGTTASCVCYDGGYAQCGATDAGQPICVNTLSDDKNCGSCANVCPNPGLLTSCENGNCACLAQTCPMVDGGLGCYDTTSDFVNCGGCVFAGDTNAHTCVVGQACINSQCQCAPGYTPCAPLAMSDGGDAGYCADTTSNKENCGSCGNACPHDQKCVQPTPGANGTCICDVTEPDGGDLIPCASGCVHSSSDPRNCGMCSVLCDTGICNAGVCQCDPDAGIFQCSTNKCANVVSDVKNCGFCGNDCTQGGVLGPPNFPEIVCLNGKCLCQGGQRDICATDAGPFPVLACIDTTADPANCGGCGLLVDGGGPYPDGALPPSPFICSGVKDTCIGGNCNCPGNEVYCASGTYTPDAGTNDAGVCLNVSNDATNCGGCGNVCTNSYAASETTNLTTICLYSTCQCIDAGICVTTDDPINPTCTCNGPYSATLPNPACTPIPTLTYTHDIYPLFKINLADAGFVGGGILVGCATSGCHAPGTTWVGDGGALFNDGGPAANLDFTDPDASYQQLAARQNQQMCGSPPTLTQILNPSVICNCVSLVVPLQGTYTSTGAGSLLTGLLGDKLYACGLPNGGTVNPMPIDSTSQYHALTPCVQTQVRQWIDQGAAY